MVTLTKEKSILLSVAVLLVSLSLSHAQVHEHKTDMPVIVTLE
jgi:hypothetical protein